MKKKFTSLFICAILAFPFSASANFTTIETKRLNTAKALLIDAETRPINVIIEKFEKTGLPQGQLVIYEAVAVTFRDIIADYGENTLESRKKLLNKIQMNMAYFQFGGSRQEQEGGSELDRLIQRKLKEHLPEDIWDNSQLFHSLE